MVYKKHSDSLALLSASASTSFPILTCQFVNIATVMTSLKHVEQETIPGSHLSETYDLPLFRSLAQVVNEMGFNQSSTHPATYVSIVFVY